MDWMANLCRGASEGDLRWGYVFGGFQSEAGIAPEADLQTALAGWIGTFTRTNATPSAPVHFRVATIGCAQTGARYDCSQPFAAVFATDGASTEHFLFVALTHEAAGPRARAFFYGITTLNREIVEGGIANLSLSTFYTGSSGSPTDQTRFIPVRD